MNWDVQPDITTVAKAITSGYAPLGAAIATKKVADSFIGSDAETFRHLITFGGHPVSSAAALANLEIFEREDLVSNSREMGEYLFSQLQRLREHENHGRHPGRPGTHRSRRTGKGPGHQGAFFRRRPAWRRSCRKCSTIGTW